MSTAWPALRAIGVQRMALAGGLSSSLEPWLSQETKRRLVPAAADALAGAVARSSGGRARGVRQLIRRLFAMAEQRKIADVRMASEIREAPLAVSSAAVRPGAALGGADAEAQAPAAARRRHLRTRELGPCGDVRKH